ncbi:MAG: amino acid ABC transporter ATP-binding protein [Candidatus Microbacterium stercoravium]
MSETAAPRTEQTIREPIIRIAQVEKSYGGVVALRGVSMDIGAGEVVVLIGPSGSGKSTLLRCVNHLEEPTAGVIQVDGHVMGYTLKRNVLRECNQSTLAAQRRSTGMVFQHFNLFEHRTAVENVMEGQISGLRETKAVASARARELLEMVGLAEKAGAYPSELSGGQQQRVAIARALATRPEVLLLDEPTSALDPELVGEVLDVISELARQGVTMMIATHEISFAEDVATTVCFMDKGIVVETGAPRDVIRNPSEERTARFLAHIGSARTADV